jgi:hypothetical protein
MGVGGVVLLVRDSVLCPLDEAVSIVYASLLTLCTMLLQLACPLKKKWGIRSFANKRLFSAA